MSIGALDAVAAYGRVTNTAAPASGSVSAVSEPGAGFGGMIENMVSEAASSLHAAEEASAKQVAGKGDMIDVATAIGSAEVALDTVVAVRDRVVSAYSEIMRMQI